MIAMRSYNNCVEEVGLLAGKIWEMLHLEFHSLPVMSASGG